MKVLFLYTELAVYFTRCCEELAREAEVHIVRWPVNQEAPFKFEVGRNITLYNRQDYDGAGLQALAARIAPDLIVCSGWIDKSYLKVCRRFFGKIPTVMSCDTRWNGTLKQRLATVLSRFTLLRIFSHAWVPGQAQVNYALRLGFKPHAIKTGFYSCDLDKFNAVYSQRREQNVVPKRFVYVGRYYEFKGLTDLWEAFTELQQERPNSWELWCLGTGSLVPVQHLGIRHFGFVQPDKMAPILAQCGVFVLPSRFEPWGVVVHEFAASGFPMILSSAVGAAETFLKEGENGLSFSAGDKESLKASLLKFINLDDKTLTSMAQRSHELGQLISPEMWARTLRTIYEQNKKK